MVVKWIIEKHMFPEYEEELISEIIKSGAECYVFDDTDHMRFDFDREITHKFHHEQCILFYGSLQRGLQLYSKTRFVPGIFLTKENYECFKYYGYYGVHHLNSDCVFLGLNDVHRRIRDIAYHNKWDDRIFIRPSNGIKSFPGQLLHLNNFEEEFHMLINSYGGLDMDELVLLAPYKQVFEESRYIVIDGEIIDGSIYMRNGERVMTKEIDENSLAYANIVKSLYTPDEIFTLDIAKINNSYRVLEVNSFCCASIYNGDIPKIVAAVNLKVGSYYKEYFNLA